MLGDNEAYCTGCGKAKPIVGSDSKDGPQRTIDARYLMVQCGRVRRPGILDLKFARQIIKARRERRKVRKALIAATYAGAAPDQTRRALANVGR